MSNKSITVSYVDCCLSGYFNGSSKPVLQYHVDGNTTRKELCDGLMSELNMGVIDYEIDNNNLSHDSIRQAIKDCIYFKPECEDEEIMFPSLEKWPEEEYEKIEPCYAFFVVNWFEEDSE